jgi:hypothetical protein
MSYERSHDLRDTDAAQYLNFLENFLGRSKVEKRLKRLERELITEKGLYKERWVLPIRSFWIGLDEGRKVINSGQSLIAPFSLKIERALEIASKLQILTPDMPAQRINDIRSSILTSDYLEPIFYELDVAMHYWRLGYDLKWSSPNLPKGVRSPEFSAVRGDHKVEIECKTTSPDTGRMVKRAQVLRLADALLAQLSGNGLSGSISILPAERLPSAQQWTKNIVAEVFQMAKTGTGNKKLPDGTEVECKLHHTDELLLPMTSIQTETNKLFHPHAHIIAYGNRQGEAIQNLVFLKVKSATPDRVLSNVLKDLRDANRQFSGDACSVIYIFIPEVPSFEGLGEESALKNMTGQFFEKHAKKHVYAVSYSSDSNRYDIGTVISKFFPAITFTNNQYDEGYGPKFSVFTGDPIILDDSA